MTREVGLGPRFVAPVLLGPLLNPINTTMISVALVPIATAVGVPTATVIWLVAALYLTSAVAQPTMGTLADRLGPKRVYLVGLGVVVVAGVIPLVSPTFGAALAARILLGIGTSAAYPTALTLIRDQSARLDVVTPPALLSALSISSLASAAVGPVLGGVLVTAFGWQAIFAVNLPLAGTAFVLALRWLPSDSTRPVAAPTGSLTRTVDLVGIGLFAAAVTSLLFFLLDLRAGYWWLLVVFAVAATAFVRWELRRDRPFVDLRLLARDGPLTRTYLRQFGSYLGIYLVTYAVSQWLQDSVGLSPDRAGLVQLPSAVLAGVASLAVSRTTRLRGPLVVAAVVPLVGGTIFATVSSDGPLWLVVVAVAMFGIPQGLASVSNQAALYRQAPPDQTGTAGGLSRTFVYVGAILASSVIGLAFGDAPSDAGMNRIGVVVVVAALGVSVLTLADRSLRSPAPGRRPPPA